MTDHTPQNTPTNHPPKALLIWGGAVLLVVAAWVGAFAMRGGGFGEPVELEGWVGGMEAGQAQAAETDRPMVVMFTADWCGPCQNLKRAVLTDPAVAAQLQADFVPVKVDMTSASGGDPRLEQYKVAGYPTVIAMTSDGREITRYPITRSPTPQGFIEWLELAKR